MLSIFIGVETFDRFFFLLTEVQEMQLGLFGGDGGLLRRLSFFALSTLAGMTGKGLTKRALLEKIQISIKSKTGYLPSLNEAIICAAQSYLNDIHLNKQQTSKIELAATAAKMTPLQILDKACDWASRFYSNKYSVEAQDLKNQKSNGTLDEFSAGSAYLRIHEFVTKLMKKNDSSKKKEDMVFINQTYLTKHQGSNRDAIKGYLQLHADVLDKHHKKHDLNPRHNLEVNTYFGKVEKEKK